MPALDPSGVSDRVREQVKQRLNHALELKAHTDTGVPAAREYVEAMLGLQVWSHKVYLATVAAAHDGGHQHGD